MEAASMGIGGAVASFGHDLGQQNEALERAYNRRAEQTVSAQTQAMSRLGLPMSECDECGTSMPMPPTSSVEDPDNHKTIWVYRERSNDDGDVYFVCSEQCRKSRRMKAVRDGYKFL